MWYAKNVQTVASELDVDLETGLSQKEVEKRLDFYGANEFKEYKKPTLMKLFFDQINSLLIYILLVSAFIFFIVGEISDAIIILVVILVNACIGVIQESKAEQALEELKKIATPKAVVKREGIIKEVPSQQIVPGDIVIVDAGRYIPADLRLIEAVNLKIEESSLTGESVPVEKDATTLDQGGIPLAEQRNIAFMSTLATYGRGVGIVVNTGMNTEIGKIASMLEISKDTTPLQKKLTELGKTLGIGSIIVSAVIFFIGFFQGRDVLDMFLISVSLAVAAIPEGLPAIVTIVLALGVERMIKRRAVVRKLPAVETLGSVSIICSDKTGTLTQNKMTVTKIYTGDQIFPLSSPVLEEPIYARIFEAISLCNDAVITKHETTGDPTEIALLEAAKKLGYDKQILDQQYKRVFEIAFDSERKMMTTVHQNNDRYLVMIKGALESILPLTSYVMKNGENIRCESKMIEKINEQANKMADEALRVLAVAFKEVDCETMFTPDKLEKDLIFLGLVGMIDPPRDEVKQSIAQCKNAGIKTIMITGDNQKTAFAIAKELGIAKEQPETLSGSELDRLSDTELREKVKFTTVFARVSPEHKVRIVKAFKANGHIVAMTGDGVNDAPSLKQADVGVAMGKNGTDVAKMAADIILTDDNFATIVSAVEEGRNIYQNIKKSIIFLLSSNIGGIVLLFVAIFLGWPAPLSAIHFLWINLLTDTLPAIALGLDPNDPDIMKQKPRSIKETIFAGGSGAFTLLYGVLIGLLSLFAFVAGLDAYTGSQSIFTIDFKNVDKDALIHAQTMAFITLSLSRLFHSFNLRHKKKALTEIGLFSNKFLLLAVIIGIAIQVILVNVPVLNKIFEIHYLTAIDWIFAITLSIVPIIFSELEKAWKRVFVIN
ncbi:calcium-transporting P-type ATPase, PMR1-type [Calidifontibacillus erzurumensis]|uniref:P-type Ca(2+) transporter n=1 Tax=Calidifontibacillus erzurumensis TaxID=2741433 RepID=A0A8J8GCC1_9BACI|nr:calcium-transporting P-type ATPase, PMR1-type [Calidifontibacillus erzurumensis]NSL51077.1 calcium-transporting P-type ATPase, PMR1-type [Calidifontibacillus erzurumensis]